jgi:succinate dehydrogenase hydrophobic anchor subunit
MFIKRVAIIITIILYFFAISQINGKNIFENPSLTSTFYFSAIGIYLLFFFQLITFTNFRYKFFFKLFVLLLIALFTAHYFTNIGNWYNNDDYLHKSTVRKYNDNSFLFSLQFIILFIYFVYVVYSRWNDSRITCPYCKKLNDFEKDDQTPELLKMKTDRELTHGRVTIKGNLDQRYNSEFEVTDTYTYKAICGYCNKKFTYSEKSSYSDNG